MSHKSFPPLDESTIRCSIRLHAAFYELLKALEYANDLKTSVWEFAIELQCLYGLKVSDNDLRWLVRAGFISHAVETTSAVDPHRRFDQPANLTFCSASCFVVTPQGAAAGRAIWGKENDWPEGGAGHFVPPIADSAMPVNPRWDCQRQELLVGSIVVKRFRVPAASQETILAAFEEESWPPRIDDPLPPRSDQSPKRRLQETIKSLNRNQKQPILHFLGDGSGEGVLWEYRGEGNSLLNRNGFHR
jgi:hypothetical protein